MTLLFMVKGVPSTENVPRARYGAAGWYDNTNKEYWMFGGSDLTDVKGASFIHIFSLYIPLILGQDLLNDLWRYRVNDSTWTWITGSNNSFDLAPIYGQRGVSSANNDPGSRYKAVAWFDSVRQEFWLFGGAGYAANHVFGYFNDVWKYEVNSNTWTWISGSNLISQPGAYGTKGSASSSNTPGSRNEACGWYDSLRQEFWLFGGYGHDRNNNSGKIASSSLVNTTNIT